MIPDLRTRASYLAEIMDEAGCDETRLANTYRDFDRVNALLSGWRGLYTRRIRPVLQEAGSGATVLDIGCGGGDVLRKLAVWAKQDGLTAHFIGADPDDRAIAYAKAAGESANLRFYTAASGDLVNAGRCFTIVLSNHVLHHLTTAQVADLCADSQRLAERFALHADICRHPVAYTAFPAVGAWFRKSYILTDGLASIRRSFTPEELRQVVPHGWHVQTAFPFRLHLEWTFH